MGQTSPDAVALLGVGRDQLRYRELWEQTLRVGGQLRAHGLTKSNRVAIVLPNGPDMAVAFLTTAACAAAAPLNPAYKESEFDFFLRDLDAKALIIAAGQESPVRVVAQGLGIPVLELHSEREAGVFTLTSDRNPAAASCEWSRDDDAALLLHTSGTTARPKLVELSQRNLAASARNIAGTLQLSGTDRCLNVMPLFHIHGLAAGLLASVTAGASVVCTPGFDPAAFFGWLDEFRPSWYTAVPTMHQSVLSQAREPRKTSLRLIRSSSSALPPSVMAALEAQFEVPVLEAYGMTEASHQVASNPLPPLVRKPGSVGLPGGPEITIIQGEVAIRGVNVTSGYVANPAANEASFTDGWFLTGDLGRIDEDGYVFLTGRSKEIINRGGEKISPREIDEVLLEHPAVAQAVAFPIPHPSLGQEVAAAIVLRAGALVERGQLREFVGARLASFKVPQRIVFLDELPKGPSGKVQRLALAERLGPEKVKPFAAPVTPTEQLVAAAWREVLRKDEVSIDDEFSELGGDSLMAAQLVAAIGERISRDPYDLDLLRVATIRAMAARIDGYNC